MKRDGRFGDYGGAYVPEILYPALEQLEAAYVEAINDDAFNQELAQLLKHYAGRPTPLYRCRNLCQETPVTLLLKREDLLHGGAHKTNQVIAQALLARRIGKTRLIAETGAGQHGVATAMAGALFGFETLIYMGAEDCVRQQLNVVRMQMLGATVVPVETGSGTLKDAINEALRDWADSYANTHYVLGTVAGPHPFPSLVRDFQSVIGREARAQVLQYFDRLPTKVIACVGGGSNAIGIFSAFINDAEVELIGVEAAGKGLDTPYHGATLLQGRNGILHGALSRLLQDDDGQVRDTYSVSAGLDYPGVGPEHVQLMLSGRAQYVGITDNEALHAFHALATSEGIIPALESAHAIAHAMKLAGQAEEETVLMVNLSGRGDKDVAQVAAIMDAQTTDSLLKVNAL